MMAAISVRVTRFPRVRVVTGRAKLQQAAVGTERIAVAVGLPGAQGPPGVAQAYRFAQPLPALLWTINHNLGRRPIVQIETPGGLLMIGDVQHLSDNIAQISFDEPTTGFASYI